MDVRLRLELNYLILSHATPIALLRIHVHVHIVLLTREVPITLQVTPSESLDFEHLLTDFQPNTNVGQPHERNQPHEYLKASACVCRRCTIERQRTQEKKQQTKHR